MLKDLDHAHFTIAVVIPDFYPYRIPDDIKKRLHLIVVYAFFEQAALDAIGCPLIADELSGREPSFTGRECPIGIALEESFT